MRVKNVDSVLSRLKKHAEVTTDADLARKLDVGKSRIYMWRRRSVVDLTLVAQKFGLLNPNWILTGEGEMYAEKPEPKEPVEQSIQDPLNDLKTRVERLEKAQKTAPELAEEVKIPLYQHAVSAGPACTVSEEIEEYLTVPKKIARHPRETFAVRAAGDSMTGEDIREGDIVICDSRTPVKTGCVVIASIDGAQTLKKIVLEKGAVTLVPANHKHDPIAITDNSNFVILGVVIALFRTLY